MTESKPGEVPLPWWYSGDSQPHAAQPHHAQSHDAQESAISALAGTAQAMVAWARQAFIDPHASHEVPAEHPECVLCRAVGAVRELLGPGGSEEPAAWSQAQPTSPIEWIEVTGDQRLDDHGP